MPAISPSKPYLASASFKPSVLRAAERAAGGKVGSTASIGGHGSTRRSSCHCAAKERLASQPDHHVGVLAQRPQERELSQSRKGFAQNVDALRFKRVEV